MASLILLKAGETKTYDLNTDEVVMGRLPECSVCIDSNMVSRKHARVFRDGSNYFVEDLGSGNGTSVNGQRIAERTLLRHEDRIKLGPILFRFEQAGAAPRPAAAPAPSPAPASATPGSAAPGSAAPSAAPAGVGAPIFDVNLDGGEGDDAPTIMGALDRGGRFGALDVQPEAKLKAILEISRTLAGTVELDSLLPKILDSLFSVFPGADRGCILLKDSTPDGKMIPKAIKHRRPGEDESVKLSRTILNKVLTEKTGVLSADAANDSRFGASESIANFTIRSMMCVPLLGLDGEPLGVINIDTQNPLKQFQTEDLDVLMAVAGQAALSYENARLAVSYMEKKKQDGEMQIAQNVQRALLPEFLPTAPGYEFFASYESAQAVGGDYYDCFLLPDDKVCLAFGDVAGKGVPGALVMSRISSVVQNTLEFVQDVGVAAERINHHMCANSVEGRFVTFTLTILDLKTAEMSLVIAGHMSPIIRKVDGTTEEFPEEIVGMPIGVVDGVAFDVVKRVLQPGEIVVIYTDGVSEAMNANQDLYGLDRLRDLISKTPPQVSALGKTVLADVKKHANGFPQNDDITLMAFGRNPVA